MTAESDSSSDTRSADASAGERDDAPDVAALDESMASVAPQTPVLKSEPEQPRRPFTDWFREGARVAVFRAPAWEGLTPATPALLTLVVVLGLLLNALTSYVAVAGDVMFYPQAIVGGWLQLVAVIFASWAVARGAASGPHAVSSGAHQRSRAPDTASLVAMNLLCTLFITLLISAIYLPLLRNGLFGGSWGSLLLWGVYGLGLLWWLAAVILLLVRESTTTQGSAIALSALIGVSAIQLWSPPAVFWYEDPSASRTEGDDPARWDRSHLRPEKLFKQAVMLDGVLAALPEQRPGQVDVYVITYSPYASENVFLNESREVSRVMAERFGTAAHTIQLVNNRSSVETLPWATPDNLRKALTHVGKLIDPAEDMVFIHFASHGGSDGKLASDFWPLQIDPLQASEVRDALDAAHIPVRMLSVSACYSGTWVAPLAGDGTLVMTASDDKHTSYGCGRKSELTFFTRAVFSEQLGSKTRDIEQALAAARPVIEAREKEAGKTDGFSNPQISVGPLAKERIARWRTQHETR